MEEAKWQLKIGGNVRHFELLIIANGQNNVPETKQQPGFAFQNAFSQRISIQSLEIIRTPSFI